MVVVVVVVVVVRSIIIIIIKGETKHVRRGDALTTLE